MPGGLWNPAMLPNRSGTYLDFIAAVTAAISPGSTGSVAVVGTADWGVANNFAICASQGDIENAFGGATWGGSVRDSALQALDGFDDGGAQLVFAYRAVGTGGVKASVVLSDVPAGPALTLTALYPGVRANNWSVTVQTNATNVLNKDILLFESGVQIAQFLNITGGTNTAAVAAITASNSPYITAAVTGTAGRALANIAGVVGGVGGLAAGNSGTTLAIGDYAAAFSTLGIYIYDAVALSNVSDGPTQDAFAAWIAAYNATSGNRTFGVIGGMLGEVPNTAIARSYAPAAVTGNYDSCDMVNMTTDLIRLSDQTALASCYLAPRMAGAISACGLARAITGVTATGYQVRNPPSDAAYTSLTANGVVSFRQDDAVTVSVEEGCTTQVTNNVTNKPAAHQRIANVAIDHFIANTIKLQGNANRGALRQIGAGRTNFLGNVTTLLKKLQTQGAIATGTIVQPDSHYDNTGSRFFIQIQLAYIEFIEQFLFTVAVSG